MFCCFGELINLFYEQIGYQNVVDFGDGFPDLLGAPPDFQLGPLVLSGPAIRENPTSLLFIFRSILRIPSFVTIPYISESVYLLLYEQQFQCKISQNFQLCQQN